MLIKKDIIKSNIKALTNETREVSDNHIFDPHLVLDLWVELL